MIKYIVKYGVIFIVLYLINENFNFIIELIFAGLFYELIFKKLIK